MDRSRAHLRLVPDLPDVSTPPEAGQPPPAADRRRAATATRPSDRPTSAIPEPLWRELLGRQLRARRHHRGERLTDVATRAGVSPQYLSEIERGRKEPSSEMIGAIGRALGTDLADLTLGVARELRRSASPSRPTGPTALLRVA